MPVKNCKSNGKPGYKWGDSGKCYTYTPNNEASRKKAKQKAHIQGAAMGMEQELQEWLDENPQQDLDDYWKELVESGKADEYISEQDKPGGSNVGKYKGVKKFCGPSGEAPSGSFPVNTRKRAIAALSYARNAPNPAGIRKCVCRAWPTLPACKAKKESASQVEVDNFIDNCKGNRIVGIYEYRRK